MSTEAINSMSLGRCLHDGIIEELRSDLTDRTLSLFIDSPFHWTFNKLSAETRFEIRLEGVRITTAYIFEPWPGGIEPPIQTSWDEAQTQRAANTAKGRMVSANWADFVAQIGTDEEHVILTAELLQTLSSSILKLGDNTYPSSDYRDIEITADRIGFFVGEEERTLSAFLSFGDTYWNDLSSRTKTNV